MLWRRLWCETVTGMDVATCTVPLALEAREQLAAGTIRRCAETDGLAGQRESGLGESELRPHSPQH